MLLRELFEKCRGKWGLTSQVLMLAEECSELSVATLHLLRAKKKNAIEHFAEEIADVELMLAGLKYYFQDYDPNESLRSKIKRYRDQKEERLRELLKDE